MLEKGTKTVYQVWVADGTAWPKLQPLALQVFSMACTTAASKRNFSMFGFVHSKLQNCLSEDNVKKLVYIKTNSFLLSDQKNEFHNCYHMSKEEDD